LQYGINSILFETFTDYTLHPAIDSLAHPEIHLHLLWSLVRARHGSARTGADDSRHSMAADSQAWADRPYPSDEVSM